MSKPCSAYHANEAERINAEYEQLNDESLYSGPGIVKYILRTRANQEVMRAKGEESCRCEWHQ